MSIFPKVSFISGKLREIADVHAMKNRHPFLLGIIFTGLIFLTGCSGNKGDSNPTSPGGEFETGIASWYGEDFQGKQTASGEAFDMNKMTAAHRILSFGTVVEVTNRKNGRRASVKINDRGPFVKDRIIDVSKRAAIELGMLESGQTEVSLRVEK